MNPALKIIKPGTGFLYKKVRGRCPDCKCLVEADNIGRKQIRPCPECGSMIELVVYLGKNEKEYR